MGQTEIIEYLDNHKGTVESTKLAEILGVTQSSLNKSLENLKILDDYQVIKRKQGKTTLVRKKPEALL